MGKYEISQNLSEHPFGIPAPLSNLVGIELKVIKDWKDMSGVVF